MKVSDITFIEAGDHYSRIVFMYDGHNLTTESFENKTGEEEIPRIIKETVEKWEELRASKNIEVLKTAYEGKEIDL